MRTYLPVLAIFLFLLPGVSFAQKTVEELTDEEKEHLVELDEKASKLYDEGKYEESYQIYQEIFSINKDGLFFEHLALEMGMFTFRRYGYLWTYIDRLDDFGDHKEEEKQLILYLMEKPETKADAEKAYAVRVIPLREDRFRYVDEKYKDTVPAHLLDKYLRDFYEQLSEYLQKQYAYAREEDKAKAGKLRGECISSFNKLHAEEKVAKIIKAFDADPEKSMKEIDRDLLPRLWEGVIVAYYPREAEELYDKLVYVRDNIKDESVMKKLFKEVTDEIDERRARYPAYYRGWKPNYVYFLNNKKLNHEQAGIINYMLSNAKAIVNDIERGDRKYTEFYKGYIAPPGLENKPTTPTTPPGQEKKQ